MVHITRTRATGDKVVRGAAIEGHVLHILLQRQSLVVLHQHHTLGSTLTGHGSMRLEIGLVGVLIPLETRAALHEVQGALDAKVEVGLVEFTATNPSHDRVELLVLTWLQHIVTGPHLLGTVLTTEPVSHHRALVAPLIAQDGGHQVLALRGIDTVDIIIRGHHRPGFRLLDGNLEALQVDLAQGTLRDMGVGIHAVRLLVVGGEVLDARANVVLLHTFDIGRSGLTSHHGVLGVVLEVSAAQGVTHDVEGRGQQHVGTILLHLFTDGLTNLLNQLLVPGRSQQRTDGEVGAIVGGGVAFTFGVDAQSGRSVSQHHGRDTQRVERIGGTGSTRHQALRGTNHGIIAREAFHTYTNHEVGLVLKRELGHHLFLVDGVLCHFVGRVTARHERRHAEGEKHYFLHRLIFLKLKGN